MRELRATNVIASVEKRLNPKPDTLIDHTLLCPVGYFSVSNSGLLGPPGSRRTNSRKFQTQRRKSWVPGKIWAEKVLAGDMRRAGRPIGDGIDKSVLNPETAMFEWGQFHLGQVSLSPTLFFDSGETKEPARANTFFHPKHSFSTWAKCGP